MKQALIVIDVQNDYFPGGAMELFAMEEAAINCQKLLVQFRENQAPVFHVKHIMTREGATFFLPNTPGSEIHETVRPIKNEQIIIKHYPSCFRETGLFDILKKAKIKEVIICGAMTHMCIDTSVRVAFDLGYKCHVIHDACATRNLEFNGQLVKAADVQAAFMAALSVPFSSVISTQEYLKP